MIVTLDAYLMGRDKLYPADFTPEILANARETVRRWNLLLIESEKDGATILAIASGWRPPAVNDKTANAGAHSLHRLAKALDGRDDGNRTFARWTMTPRGLDAARRIGIWYESPQWTPTWGHGGTSPPASGHRVYIPSTAPPLCDALPGELAARSTS